MKFNYKHKIKYIDFNNFALLSWHIRDTSIEHISKLSMIATYQNLYKIICPYEFIILSTCNRVEIYVYSSKSENLIEDIKAYINDKLKNDIYISNSLEIFKSEKAYRHLLKVTSGLASLALGEYQIQGQVKNAYLSAIQNQYIRSYLISIFESALKTGKRIRTETKIGYNNISLSSLAIDIMFQYHKPKKKSPILIVGTGKMSKLETEYFIKMGYKFIIFFSNSPKQRKDFAQKYNSLILPIEELVSYIKKYKFIFSAISIQASKISLDSADHNSSALSIIDLSVPSYFHKSTITHANSIIIDMDTIKKLEHNYFSVLEPCLKQCDKIINEEIRSFVSNNKRRYEINKFYSSNKLKLKTNTLYPL